MASIASYISHDSEGQPVLVLYRKNRADGPKGYIPLKDAWLYSEDHNPNFERQMMATVAASYEYFGVGRGLVVSKKSVARQMAEIASVIESSIDDLVKAPCKEISKGKVVQDGSVTINDHTIQLEQTDKGTINAY